MAWACYNTYTFTNDTGLKANGLHIECSHAEIVSVNGKPPEGLGHGDYGVSGNGKRINIFAIETLPGRKLKVRIKGRTSPIVMTSNCYWTKDGKKLKALKIPDNLFTTTSPDTEASSFFKVRKLK